jgi:hypothetical protein
LNLFEVEYDGLWWKCIASVCNTSIWKLVALMTNELRKAQVEIFVGQV